LISLAKDNQITIWSIAYRYDNTFFDKFTSKFFGLSTFYWQPNAWKG